MKIIKWLIHLIQKYPWFSFLVYFFVTAIMYSSISNYSITQPLLLSPTSFDKLIPFTPIAVPFYLSYFLLIPAFVALFKTNKLWFGKFFLVITLCIIGNLIINLLLPAAIIKSISPEGIFLFKLIHSTDGPYCALPSGHVALPFCLSILFVFINHKLKWLYIIWTIILSYSVLAVNQHYYIDVITGLLWGAMAAAIGLKLIPILISILKTYQINLHTIRALIQEWILIIIIFCIVIYYWNIITIPIAIILIATRQHALFILYHDAVHYLICKNKRMNDAITNIFIGIPQTLPVHMYRTLHLCHHRWLGTQYDPERIFLYKNQDWNYKPLPALKLLRQLLLDLLLWNNLKMTYYYFKEKNSPESKLKDYKGKVYPEFFITLIIIVALTGLGLYLFPGVMAKVLLIWLLPLFTLTQLIQKIRSFAEHTGSEKEGISNSWHPGWLARFILWPYNINYHHEHHLKQGISWDQLPTQFPNTKQRSSYSLWRYLFNGKWR